jgi:hypothetical protein
MKTSEFGVDFKDTSRTQLKRTKIRRICGKSLAYAVAQAICFFLSFENIVGKVDVANHTPYWSATSYTMVILEHPDFWSDGISKLRGNLTSAPRSS